MFLPERWIIGPKTCPGFNSWISIPQPTTESITQIQYSSGMPYLESSDETDVVTKDNVSNENEAQKEEDEDEEKY